VILADDDDAITSNLAPFLERAGLTVHIAPDGCTLDVLMPRLDGREALRRLRADLNKPFDPYELLARLRAVIRRAPVLTEAWRLSHGFG
jgi:DNA-binding response OmpR family regulator